MGVTLQAGVYLPEARQLVDGKVPRFREHRVECRTRMGFAEDETITIRPGRVGRVVNHYATVQDRKYVRLRQRAAGMAAIGRGDHL